MLAIMSFNVTIHSFNISQNNSPLPKIMLVKLCQMAVDSNTNIAQIDMNRN